MRYDSEQKQRTREKVLDVAAKAIRAEGPDRIGVAGVMAEAGLTHGGFYAHFKSKDELVAAAIERMFEDSRARVRRETEGRDAAQGLAAYIDFYLSKKHRDARESGCAMAALASDLPRLSDQTREIFATGTRRLAETLAAKLTELGHADAEAQGRLLVAELVGALSLARIDPSVTRSNALLADTKRLIKQRLGLAD
ncbi:TetR/AcrR family transcriptional regulator [Dyella acidiphila]|uniref:TetR/AcrR family transcriptional regulator n=1 Tax=Dyella acidiphila TaxID=2775866 RepID=A0ABR9G9M7_9GAMM|nr:TetR/AcrR family transcriptional regulator [Dyella acidiphila]MBE1160729.1 TetR/AcrR family transcriptional regulator [Dyella acidiphila]